MKAFKTAVHYLLPGTALLISFSFGSCKDSNENKDPKEAAEKQNEAGFTNSDTLKSAKFLVEAAEINLEEISLGDLAQKTSSNKDVKDLGKMMSSAHMQAQKSLMNLAANKKIAVPDSISNDGKKEERKLMEKKGTDFDKAYCDAMVKGHKEAIRKFEKVSTDSPDADIRSWAATILPDLRMHLDHALDCQAKVK